MLLSFLFSVNKSLPVIYGYRYPGGYLLLGQV